MESLASLLPLLVIGLAFWLLILRPAKQRQKAAANLQDQLTPGVRVLTTAGLYATVVSVDEDSMLLESSPGVTSRWAKGALARVLPDETTESGIGSVEQAGPAGAGSGTSEGIDLSKG